MTEAAPASTLSARIRDEIEGRILSGEWRPGHRIPFEQDLAARYGCARMTVNKALASLAAAGLIERRRRAGSFVAQPAAEQAPMAIADFAAEAGRRGLSYAHEILFRRLDRRAGTLRLRARHRIGGVAVAIEERTIHLAAAPGADTADFAATPPGTWLLRHVPWTEAEHVLSAHNADPATAAALEVAPGAACLVLERRTWNSAAAVTAVRLIHAGERHRFAGRFSRSAA